jgi:PAS domain-containing protein
VHSTEIIDLKDALQMQKGLALLVAADGSDGKLSIAHASDELCKLLGKDSKYEAGKAASSSKLLTSTSKEVLLKTTREVTSGKPGMRSILLALYCEDARMICARASGQPVADTSLVMTHVLYTLELLDIEMLSAAIASLDNTDTAELIASTKVPFSIKHASPAWCRLYGLTNAEVSGRSMQIVHGPLTDQRAVIRMFSDAVTGQHGRGLLTCYHKEGTAVTAMMTMCPLMADNGAVDHVRVVVNPSSAHVEPLIEGEPVAVSQTAQKAHNQAKMSLAWDLEDEVVCADPSARTTSAGAPTAKPCSPMDSKLSPPEACLSRTASGHAAKICPEGRITHLDGRTQLVLYPTADPAVKHCLVYLDMLHDASIVSKWEWEGDALKVDLDSHKVLARTQKSAWCRMWTADLRTWHAWWNRMLWIISDALRNSPAPFHDTCCADVAPLAAPCSSPTLSALIRVDDELCLSGMTSSVCIVDTHSRVVFANSAFLRMMRYSSYQLLGAPLFGLCAKGADPVEVSRVKFCLQSCALDRRQLSTCLLLRKGDGSMLWASVLGEPVPVADYEISATSPHKVTATPARGRVAWRTCMLMSIEDSSDIVSPSSPWPAALVNEPLEENNLADVNDPYVMQMAQELAVMQDQTVAEWKDALASLHGSMLTPTPQVAGEGMPCVSSSDKAESRDECQKILVQIAGDISRLGVVEALWQLKTQGHVKAWRWECDFLSLTIKADSLRPHAALAAARLPERGGGRLGFRCLDDADLLRAGTWQQRIACLVRSTLQDGVLASEAGVPGASLHAALLAQDHSALHPSRREAAKLAEPGIDFDFLTVADGGSVNASASVPAEVAVQRHAKKEQVRQAQAAAQHSALRVSAAAKATAPHMAQVLAAERRKVERLEELLEQEVTAKLNANASALAASAQNALLWREVKRLEERVDTQGLALEAKAQALQSVFAQQEIDRSVSGVALKAMESSLHRKTCEIESLLARLAQLTDETQILKGMLELGASSSDNQGSSSSDTQGSSSRGVCM